jgi:hypothetical protein
MTSCTIVGNKIAYIKCSEQVTLMKLVVSVENRVDAKKLPRKGVKLGPRVEETLHICKGQLSKEAECLIIGTPSTYH